MQGLSLKRDHEMSFAFENTSHISLSCKLIPVLLLVFSVTPLKIDENQNQNDSID